MARVITWRLRGMPPPDLYPIWQSELETTDSDDLSMSTYKYFELQDGSAKFVETDFLIYCRMNKIRFFYRYM